MDPAIDTEDLIHRLLQPAAYPHAPEEVELVRTHISLVFLAGELVYKVKRPVVFEFLDFRELEQRRRFCEEELRLNRRLAARIYRRVVPVRWDAEGVVSVGGGEQSGEIVEWALEMVRMPQDRMFDRLLARAEIDNAEMNELAEVLTAFHGRAEPAPEYGEVGAVEALVLGNLHECRGFTEGAVQHLSPELLGCLEARARRFLAREVDLFERRVRESRIREGHGDLHARNICFDPAGLAVYDCIEFSRAFRCGDVALDLAFLAMDLDYRGFPTFARYLVHRYVKASGDGELERLLPFYKAHRAVVRGKVAALTRAGAEGDSAIALEREAMGYFQLAAGYGQGPVAVLMCGLPASGKSWAGPALCRSLRAVWLRSDVRRKVLAGMAPTDHRRTDELYSEEMNHRTYRSLLEQMIELLEAGRSVVLDATFSRARLRRIFVDAATRMGYPCLVVHMEASEEDVRARMIQRATDTDEVSDADFAVYLRARETFEAPDEIAPERLVAVRDNEAYPERIVARVLQRLIEPSWLSGPG